MRRALTAWVRPLLFFALAAALSVGCGGGVPADSACRGLTYADSGPTRKEYLPCAGEMVAVLEKLDTQVGAAVKGDRQARGQGQVQVQTLRALMNAAGGRKLLERWSDAALTDFNLAVSNAITHYDAFYMIRVPDESNPHAGQARDAARNEADAAARRADQAMRLYRRLN